MKKIASLFCIILVLSGCIAKTISLDEINTNLSSSNPNISIYYDHNIDGYTDFSETAITSDSFKDASKSDKPELLDEMYYERVRRYEEWILPQYDKMIQELTSAKYEEIDYISGTYGLLMIIENKDNGYKLYIYKDNKIKIIDGDDTTSYQAKDRLEYTYSLLDDFADKITDFFTQMRKELSNAQ